MSTNELELRLHVEPVVREALRELYSINLDRIRSERTNTAGRFDTAYGGVVVEYEWAMGAARRAHGADQALNYLAAERARHGDPETMYSAVVTDGVSWGFLVADALNDAQMTLFVQPPTNPALRFAWVANSPSACRRFLELVGSNPRGPVTGDALVRALGRGSAVARSGVSQLLEAVRNRGRGDRIDTFYGEWRRALEVAYGRLDDTDSRGVEAVRVEFALAGTGTLGEVLFALHTYFVLVARLIAVEVLAISAGDQARRPSNWGGLTGAQLAAQLHGIESGRLPGGLHVGNLVEGDVFSWYEERLRSNVSMQGFVRDVCGVLGGFAFPRMAFGAAPTVDIFRELYQGLTPRELRKALGEFLTPSWLAGATIEAVRENGADLARDRVLDCTCGTGTFLAPIISARLQALRRSEAPPSAAEIQDVLLSVCGIDINPVAVVAARLNYLMALGDFASQAQVFIPIWLADSVLLPGESQRQGNLAADRLLVGRRYFELSTSLDRPFPIPHEFLHQQLLAVLSEEMRRSLEVGHSPTEFAGSIRARLGPDSAEPKIATNEAWENAEAVLLVLYEHILELSRAGRDGVWAEIIENRFAPFFLGKFDVVVGNPPWLSYVNLPEAWRRAAEPVWRNYGLYDVPRLPALNETRSLQTSDIATLVTAVALERYLRPGGLLGFVLPKALANADPGNRAFRRVWLAR